LELKLAMLRKDALPLPPPSKRVVATYYISTNNVLCRWRADSRLDYLSIEHFAKERVRARAKDKRVRDQHAKCSA
jgi:hypothetical protein